MGLDHTLDVLRGYLARRSEKIVTEQGEVTIRDEDFIRLTGSNREVVFVDGGQAALLEAPNYGVYLMRCAYAQFIGRERRDVGREEWYVLLTREGDTIRVHCDIDIPDFSLYDKHLSHKQVTLDLVAGQVRKLLELHYACSLIEKYPQALLVRDGDLSVQHPFEERYYARLGEHSIMGLCKTTHMRTDSGMSLGVLRRDGSWLYPCGVGEGYAKLSAYSEYVFRVQGLDLEEGCSALSALSDDPGFIGYPYGLVVVDSLARVSNNEREQLRMSCLYQLQETFRDAALHEKMIDAHSVLDKK